MSEKNSVGALIGGMLIGSAVGTIFGLLVAPRTGKETRRLLKKSAEALPELAEDLSTTLNLQADRLSESARLNWDGTLERLRDAIAAGIEASQVEANQLKKSREVSDDIRSSVSEQN